MPAIAASEPSAVSRTDPTPDAARSRAGGDSFGAALSLAISPQAPNASSVRQAAGPPPPSGTPSGTEASTVQSFLPPETSAGANSPGAVGSSNETVASVAIPAAGFGLDARSFATLAAPVASGTVASGTAASRSDSSEPAVSGTTAFSSATSDTITLGDDGKSVTASGTTGFGTATSGTIAPDASASGSVASGSIRSATSISGTAAPGSAGLSAAAPGIVAPRNGTPDATKPDVAPANTATPDTQDVAVTSPSTADVVQTGLTAALPMRQGAALPAGVTHHALARDAAARDAAAQDRNTTADDTAAAPAAPPPASPLPVAGLALVTSFASTPAGSGSIDTPVCSIVRDLAVPVRVQTETALSAPASVDAAAAPAAPSTRPAPDPVIPTGVALAAATPNDFSAGPGPASGLFAVPDASQPQARHAPGDLAMSATRAAVSSETMTRASPAEASAIQAASGPAAPTQSAQAPAAPAQDPTQATALFPAQFAPPAAPSATPPAAGPVTPAELAPSPAAQVVPAMLAMHTANGAQNMMLRLTPSELGTVQIQISRDHDGAASVSVLVERPETLRLLLHDQAQLQHALTQAGLPQDRIVAFQQAPAGSFAAQEHRASTQDPGQGAGQGPGAGSDQGQASQDGAARQQTRQGHDARPGAGRFGAGVQSYASAWQPASIDITA